MRTTQLILLAAFLLLLAGCSPGVEGKGIASNRPSATDLVPAGAATVVEIPELTEAPEAYEWERLQVTGRYRRSPVIVCDGLKRPSPATWTLSDGEQVIAARGFEHLVHPLLPANLTMTVEGVWRHWRGPVGCGKDALIQDVWHLVVTDVLAPSPLARVTLTPAGQTPTATGEVVGEAPTATATRSGPGPIGTPIVGPSPSPGATATPAPTPSPTEAAAGATETPTPISATATTGATATPDLTVTVTATVTDVPSPTATQVGDATPTPTRTVVDQGHIDAQDLRGDYMGVGEIHSWQFDVRAGDLITISVAARLETDVTLSVLDPAGNRVVEQNDSPAGQVERTERFEAAGTGAYRVLISEAGGRETDYMVLLLNDGFEDYYSFLFQGVLSYGSSRTSQMAEETDQFWFFFGNVGERINLNVSANDSSNLFLDLYRPDGSLEVEFLDEAAAGGAEQLLNYQLPVTGLYGVRVGEVNFNPANYTILVARN